MHYQKLINFPHHEQTDPESNWNKWRETQPGSEMALRKLEGY
jgi:hypothetical protein